VIRLLTCISVICIQYFTSLLARNMQEARSCPEKQLVQFYAIDSNKNPKTDGQTLCATPLNSWGHFEGRMMLSLSSRLGSSREAMSLKRGSLSLHINSCMSSSCNFERGPEYENESSILCYKFAYVNYASVLHVMLNKNGWGRKGFFIRVMCCVGHVSTCRLLDF